MTNFTLHRIFHVMIVAMIGAWLAGCDVAPRPPVVPTFIPPTVTVPTPNSATGGSSRVLSNSKAPTFVQVTRGAISQVIKARGRVVSRREALLYFPLRGTINKINVATGDQVTQGTVLAELDAYELEDAVDDAQFNLDQANFQLRQAVARLAVFDFRLKTATDIESESRKASDQAWQAFLPHLRTGLDSDIAWQRYTRFQDLNTKHLNAAADLNTVKADQQVATLEVEAKKQAVQLMQKKVDRAQKRLSNTKLIVPFSGLVTAIDKKVGDSLSPFEPMGAIADPAQLQLEASIAEEDVGYVALGQMVSVVLDGFPDQKFSGKVKEIAVKPSIFQGKSLYRTILVFDDSTKVPATLRMGADVSFTGQSKADTLLVPSNTISAVGAKRFVTAVRDGKPLRVEIQVGIENETHSEILFGISEGDQIQQP